MMNTRSTFWRHLNAIFKTVVSIVLYLHILGFHALPWQKTKLCLVTQTKEMIKILLFKGTQHGCYDVRWKQNRQFQYLNNHFGTIKVSLHAESLFKPTNE